MPGAGAPLQILKEGFHWKEGSCEPVQKALRIYSISSVQLHSSEQSIWYVALWNGHWWYFCSAIFTNLPCTVFVWGNIHKYLPCTVFVFSNIHKYLPCTVFVWGNIQANCWGQSPPDWRFLISLLSATEMASIFSMFFVFVIYKLDLVSWFCFIKSWGKICAANNFLCSTETLKGALIRIDGR